MCADRVAAGEEPACAKVCPTDAIVFGEREDLIAEAENRIHRNPRGYVHHIYGKDEVGGTCVLHLSNVPFELLGYRTDLPKISLREYTKTAMQVVPHVKIGLAVALGAVSWVIQRRIRNGKIEENGSSSGGES